MLNEVHLFPDRAFSDNVVIGLEYLKLQLAQHPRHKVGVRVGEQRHGGHKFAAIEVDNFLVKEESKLSVRYMRSIIIFTYNMKNEHQLGTV